MTWDRAANFESHVIPLYLGGQAGDLEHTVLGHSSLAQTDEPASAQMLKCSRWIDTQQSDCKVVQTDPNTTVAISRLDWDERQRRMATVGNDG